MKLLVANFANELTSPQWKQRLESQSGTCLAEYWCANYFCVLGL